MKKDMDALPASPNPEAPADNLQTDPARAAALFEQAAAIMARLRAPGGCPWDREQSFDSVRKYTLEEAWPRSSTQSSAATFRTLPRNSAICCFRCCFMPRWHAERSAGILTVVDGLIDHLNRKLIRRHPHVFGEEASRAAGNEAAVDAAVEGSAARVLRNWEEIKASVRAATWPF